MKWPASTFFILLFALTTCTAAETNSTTSVTHSPSVTVRATSPQPTLSPRNAGTDTPMPEPTDEPIGTLKLEENRVEHGSEANTLQQILADITFFANDIVRVTDGGEALLDFGDKMLMRLFNDTEMQMISAEIASDVPWQVRFFLYRGGFTGQLTEEGGQAVYETPGGTQITVLGTEYFVVYDPAAGATIVGNFAGSVEVTGGGETLNLPDGYFVTVPDNEPPNLPQPLPLSLTEFEQKARDTQSPNQAANEVGEWLLDMTWQWLAFPEYEEVLLYVTWAGEFQVEGNRIIGQGTGTMESPPPGENDIITVSAGSFQFDIDGIVRVDDNGNPTFEFEIQGYNNSIEITEISCEGYSRSLQCEDISLLVNRISQVLAEELHTVTAPIVINAENGATATAEIDGSQMTHPTIFDEEPMVGYDFHSPVVNVVISSGSR